MRNCSMHSVKDWKKECGVYEKPLLEDVDGTLIQIYVYPRGHVIIKNDEMLGDVHVESGV